MLSTKDLDNLLLEYDLESDPDYGVSYVYCLKCLQETGRSNRFKILRNTHFLKKHADECYTFEDYENEFAGVKTICDEYSRRISEKNKETWKNYTPEEKQNMINKIFGTPEEMSKRTIKRWENYTPEEREKYITDRFGTSEDISKRSKNMWKNFTPEERQDFSEKMSEINRNRWDKYTPEERQDIITKRFGNFEEKGKRTKKMWENFTPEERQDFINRTFGTPEERGKRVKNMWKNFTPEEREDYINKIKIKRNNK